MNVRFTEEEMQKVNLTSLKLKDGSGYVGSFTAYHEVHCVVSQTRCLIGIKLKTKF
jgi:hypothetical protein